MNVKRLIVAVVATSTIAVTAAPVVAQTPRAQVRTWAGEAYELADPSLEVLYTIQVKRKDEGPEPAESAQSTGAKTPMLFGTASAIGAFLDKQPEPLHGHRLRDTVTLLKDGTEIRLELASITALVFARQPVRTELPPYIAAQQYRYAATAVLNDGSRIEGTYVNLGTTFLRGRTMHGRVDIPWDQIEVVRFTR